MIILIKEIIRRLSPVFARGFSRKVSRIKNKAMLPRVRYTFGISASSVVMALMFQNCAARPDVRASSQQKLVVSAPKAGAVKLTSRDLNP